MESVWWPGLVVLMLLQVGGGGECVKASVGGAWAAAGDEGEGEGARPDGGTRPGGACAQVRKGGGAGEGQGREGERRGGKSTGGGGAHDVGRQDVQQPLPLSVSSASLCCEYLPEDMNPKS